eukprot:141238-Chlamydomonas_euryale.AAC.1
MNASMSTALTVDVDALPRSSVVCDCIDSGCGCIAVFDSGDLEVSARHSRCGPRRRRMRGPAPEAAPWHHPNFRIRRSPKRLFVSPGILTCSFSGADSGCLLVNIPGFVHVVVPDSWTVFQVHMGTFTVLKLDSSMRTEIRMYAKPLELNTKC